MNKQLEEKLIIILDNHIDFAEWATSASKQTELLDELSTLINKEREDAVSGKVVELMQSYLLEKEKVNSDQDKPL